MGDLVPIKTVATVAAVPRTDGRRIFEISSTGIDENLQLVGSDPFGGTSQLGLRVPTLATPDLKSRYLANLVSFSLGEQTRAKIIGYRQFVSIGVKQAGADGAAPYIEELEVTDPRWHFQDGNVSWHLQQIGPPNNQGFAPPDRGPADVRNFKFRWCETPAFLYQSATLVDQYYVNLTAYTPPNGGKPWGRPLRNGAWPSVLDLRGRWRDDSVWGSLDIDLCGPDTIAFFASVRQTNASARAKLSVPMTFYPHGLSPESAFLLNFPSAIYWRVAGSLIVELY
jgi:hypothetical protein